MQADIDGFINPAKQDTLRVAHLNSVLLAIHAKSLTLQQLVEHLGPYLTSLDNETRSRGTLLLSEVLSRLPELKLEPTQVTFIADFYCARLQDSACVPEVLKGAHALMHHHALETGAETRLLRALFAEVNVASLTQPQRQLCLELLSKALDRYEPRLRTMGADLLVGCMQAMDGEKDPRNLVLSFALAVRLPSFPEFDRFAEEMFELLSCYFPITFRAKPTDPNAVAPDDLRAALDKAMAASPLYAPHAVSFLVEKLGASQLETKLQVLRTLLMCVRAYGPEAAEPHLDTIWTAVRTEVMTGKEAAAVDAALHFLSELVKALAAAAPSVSAWDGNKAAPTPPRALLRLMGPLLQYCVHELRSPDSKVALQAARLLQAAASGAVPACRAVAAAAVPVVLAQLPAAAASPRAALLELLTRFVDAAEVARSFDPRDPSHPLAPFAPALRAACLEGVAAPGDPAAAPHVRAAALGGLAALSRLRLFSPDEALDVVTRLSPALLGADIDLSARLQTLRVLHTIAEFAPAAVVQALLPLLLAALDKPGAELKESLHALGVLAGQPVVLQAVLPELASRATASPQSPRAVAILEQLANMLQAHSTRPEVVALFATPTFVRPLLQLSAVALLRGEPPSPLISRVARLLQLIAQSLADTEATAFIEQIRRVCVEGDVSAVGLEAAPPVAGSVERSLLLLSPVLGAAPASYAVPNAASLLLQLLQIAQSQHDLAVRLAANHLLAALVNKQPEDSLAAFVQKTAPTLLSAAAGAESQTATSAVDTLTWLAKALLVRGRPEACELIAGLASLLAGPHGEHVARAAFAALLADDEVLSRHARSNIRVLYKQRWFLFALPLLLQRFQQGAGDDSNQARCLLAIGGLLRQVPRAVLLAELPRVLPLLLRALTASDAGLLASTLDSLAVLLSDAPNALVPHLNSLLSPLLVLARRMDSVPLRTKALQNLQQLTALPYQSVFPYRTQVLAALTKCLDDPKRAVRREAVVARNLWYVLSAAQP